MAKQLELMFRSRGGRRRGAGRKPTTVRGGVVRAGVPHRRRPQHTRWRPLHVTVRLDDTALACVRTLRHRDCHRVLRRALVHGCIRDRAQGRFRICHYSIQRTHIHLIVEADSSAALSRGMQGFNIRVARGLNRLLGRTGRVLGDRYHAHALASPREVRNALCYVLNNARRHGEHRGIPAGLQRQWLDPFASGHVFDGWRSPRAAGCTGARPRDDTRAQARASLPGEPAAVAMPETWLLCHGWRQHGLIAIDEQPAGRTRN